MVSTEHVDGRACPRTLAAKGAGAALLALACGVGAGGPGPEVSQAPAAAGATLSLVNELGYDQESERVRVFLDDALAGELAVDPSRPRAELELQLARPVHRYRLEGEARLEGVPYRIGGGGLIVTSGRMDEIAERPRTAAEALAAYTALVDQVRAAAPGADLDSLPVVQGPRARAEDVRTAEQRLEITLPEAYRRLVEEVGPFRLGTGELTAGAVLAPHELTTVLGFYLRSLRSNGWDDERELRGLEQRIARRHRQSTRDVVLDHFELEEPTVLILGHRCPDGEVAVALPGSDLDLLGADPADNPFLGLIGYDDIMGEPECCDYDRLLAYSLHDHLLTMGDEALFVRTQEIGSVGFYRARTDEDRHEIWLRLIDLDAAE